MKIIKVKIWFIFHVNVKITLDSNFVIFIEVYGQKKRDIPKEKANIWAELINWISQVFADNT